MRLYYDKTRMTRTWIVGLLLALTALLLTACQGQTPPSPPSASSTQSAAASNTAITQPLVAPAICSASGGTPLAVSGVQYQRYGSRDINYYERLADTLSPKPQPVSVATNGSPVALKTTAYYDFAVTAPPTGQQGSICGVTVRIVAFQPLTAPAPNIYRPCVDQSYSDPGGWTPSTACPAGPVPAGDGTVSFTSSNVGATVTAPINGHDPNTFQPWNKPAVEPPPLVGPTAAGPTDILVQINVAQPGTYTVSMSLWQDSGGPSITVPNQTLQFLGGQASQEWSGGACTTAAMQSELPPPTNPPTQLICPGPVSQQ